MQDRTIHRAPEECKANSGRKIKTNSRIGCSYIIKLFLSLQASTSHVVPGGNFYDDSSSGEFFVLFFRYTCKIFNGFFWHCPSPRQKDIRVGVYRLA